MEYCIYSKILYIQCFLNNIVRYLPINNITLYIQCNIVNIDIFNIKGFKNYELIKFAHTML